jgi:hypothetical protein
MTETSAASPTISLKGPMAGLAGLLVLALFMPAYDLGLAILAASKDDAGATLPAVISPVVREWQSLLGALFTPLAAVLGAWAVLRQIQENNAHEAARLRRVWRARRAAMPMVMSRVCDYAERSAALLREARATADSEHVVVGSRFAGKAPQLEEVTLNHILAMVEAAQTDREANAYQQLLHELQVHASRWRGFTGASGQQPERYFPHDVDAEIVDAAEIYARASNLLVMARPEGHAPGVPMSRYNGLFALGFRDDTAPPFKLAIAFDQSSPLSN